MLYYLLYPLRDEFIAFNVVRYITFRSLMALFTALIIYLLWGRPFIRYLRRKQFWQTVRDDGPFSHYQQKGETPTLGGILILLSMFISSLLWMKWSVAYTWLCLGVILAFALIGFLDDYRKIVLKDSHGLRARYKFPLQVLVTTIAALILFDGLGFDTHLNIPFFKRVVVDLGWWYIPFAVLVIVGASNAVNLTDGLDGLVTVPSIMAFAAYAILAYVAGHAILSDYLQVPFVVGSGELAVICAAIVGSCIGFLWFNSHPADIFMGDVGSLPIGASLGAVAVMTKNELLLLLIGGIFVLETVSVITQVISFKLWGKRVFKMAPLHHHFELRGWTESKVTVRFWIVAMILALISLSTLKLR